MGGVHHDEPPCTATAVSNALELLTATVAVAVLLSGLQGETEGTRDGTSRWQGTSLKKHIQYWRGQIGKLQRGDLHPLTSQKAPVPQWDLGPLAGTGPKKERGWGGC